jgi:hypothetical protein
MIELEGYSSSDEESHHTLNSTTKMRNYSGKSQNSMTSMNKTTQAFTQTQYSIGTSDKSLPYIQTQQQPQEQKEFMKEGNEMMFVLSVDGSDHSEYAFDLIVKEFLQGNKLFLLYVFNEKQDYLYNYKNKKDIVIDHYNTLLINHLKQERSHFLSEERNNTSMHPLEQVNKMCYKLKADFLFCGFSGIKGPRCENKELSKGVDYLLCNSRSPTVIIKESKLRGTSGYKWLFVFDRAYTNCYSTLNYFMSLIDSSKDEVYGLTLLPAYFSYDDVKKDFQEKFQKMAQDRVFYDCQEYLKTASSVVNEKINYGEIQYDFVILYNSPEKHKSDGANSDIVNIIIKANCNVCFINGGYIHSH